MPRFIALPVGQGDAFYLNRRDWSALVDGGRAQASFPGIFQATTGADSVDVLVCTHNDADHANGVIGYIESGLGCGELWLPGRWLPALAGVLEPFANVFSSLAEEMEREEMLKGFDHAQTLDTTPLEQFAERVFDRQQHAEFGPEVPLTEGGWPENLREALERAMPWEPHAWPVSAELELWSQAPGRLLTIVLTSNPAHTRLFWSAINAARRIRAIALAAFHRGIPVVWFEYDTTRPSGKCGELVPLNARAIAEFRPARGSLFVYLALTVTNRESLVFWSPRADDFPGVLFNADSDLSGVKLPSNIDGAIATAPHHGSEANRNVYPVVAKSAADADSLIWVRSDGRFKSRPGPGYLSVSGRRLCTMCRLPGGRSSPKRPVQLFARRGSWVRHSASPKKCECA